MSKKTLLIITDGIGHNSSSKYNAFANANKPTYDNLFQNHPNSLIKTYGQYVGLPNGQMGNSEVGHMSLGSGRVLFQDLVKINNAIQDNSFEQNTNYRKLVDNSNTIHLVGLLSDGGVHSHINHLIYMAKQIASMKKEVKIHLITDGRDVAYNSAKTYIQQILDIQNDYISIATISGRYYTMDRDNNWDRIKLGYDVIANAQNKVDDILSYLQAQYKDEIYDEFIVPASLEGYNGIKQNDGLIFCNFRSDRSRQISQAFASEDFVHFTQTTPKINIATMTKYSDSLPIDILFPKQTTKNTLAQVISDAKLTQLHTAETEKYAHVTFFFNGGQEEPFENEQRALVKSPNVKTYDLQPEMSAPQVTQEVIKGMQENKDFIVVNFANGDMVGHTGNFDAGVKAVEAVDLALGELLLCAKKTNYNVIITSDHGNCEQMKDEDGKTLTNHTVGDVFCFVVSQKVSKIKDGSLENIAPSVLKLMELDIPNDMSEPLF